VKHLLVIGLLVSTPAFGQWCTVKEYAQYKDMAASAQGRSWLATDYCDAERTIDSANARARLAVQYGDTGALQKAHADGDTCISVMYKTRDALKAAGAEDWIKYAYGHCQGPRPQ